MMDTVLFQGDNWLYFPTSEALVSQSLLSRTRAGGIESCLAGPLLRWGSTAGALMTGERERHRERYREAEKES